MYNMVCTIALAIMFLLLLPASNSSSKSSPDSSVYTTKDTTAYHKERDNFEGKLQIKSELCPALLELPLMLGRPAPCARGYSPKDK